MVLEQKDITTFHNDAGIRTTQVVDETHLTSKIFEESEQMTDLSIISFLERPKKLLTGSFATGDAYGNIGGVAFTDPFMPQDGLTNPLTLNKLQGVAGIRYDLEFEIVTNCTRFAQGLYGLFFCYTGGCNKDRAGEWKAPHMYSWIQRSQLLHTRLDLNCDTRAVLKVPWNSAYNFMPLSSINSSFSSSKHIGNLGYLTFCPMFSGTPSTAIKPGTESGTWTIYWRMTNIKLVAAGAYPQMDFSQSEALSKTAGPVQSTAVKVSKALDLFKGVPLISDYVRPLKWTADLTGKVASVFGWARPQNDSTGVRVKRKPFMHVNNVDALDNSDNMALTTVNKVGVLPGFVSTNLDEMEITTFASRYCIYTILNLTSSLGIGDYLSAIPVAPYPPNPSPSGSISHSPLSYAASLFQYWRGGIKFKLTFVKTEFHSGRLSVSFNPRFNNLSYNSSYTDTDYMYRDIIDLRYCNEFTFIIPYVAITPYMVTYPRRDLNQIFGDIGELLIHVVDPLKAPPSVNPNVTILVEYAGAEDIEFAVPAPLNYSPVINVTPQMDMTDCADLAKPLGNMKLGQKSLDYAQGSIGEKITNFRTLLKRFTAVKSDITTQAGTAFNIRPWLISWWDTDYPPSHDPPDPLPANGWVNGPDLYTQLGSIFLLSRGGVRLKYVNPSPKVKTGADYETNALGQAYFNYDYINNFPYTNEQNAKIWAANSVNLNKDSINSNNVVYFNPWNEYGVEIDVPQYSLFHSRPNAELRCGGRYVWPQAYTDITSTLQSVNIEDPSLDNYKIEESNGYHAFFMRAGSEDTNFGMFVSIPPMKQWNDVM